MCGLGGIVRVHAGGGAPPPEVAIPEEWLDALDASVMHRGPDGCGRLRDRIVRPDGAAIDAAFVHRRLSILDHEGGGQPMAAAAGDRAAAIVLNGCIYNHRALRSRLESRGQRFASDHSDTEVLLRGWLAWGEDVLSAVDGMYAAALWDRRTGVLTLARDRFGEKPLYVRGSGDGGTIAFASTPAGLWSLPLDQSPGASPAPPTVDGAALLRWIARGYHEELTPLKGVAQLPAGVARRLEAEAGGWSWRDWRPRPVEWPGPMSLRRGPGADGVERLLRKSVAERLDADVPVACLLSGGVDSSLVSLYAGEASGRITTICVRMGHESYDESAHAQRVAEVIGSEHVTIDAPADPASDLAELIGALGLPFGDSSLLPTYWACAAAAERAGVLLTGDGGDELFLGYERYFAAEPLDLAWMMYAALPVEIPPALLARRDPKGWGEKAGRFFEAARGWGYEDLLNIFGARDMRGLTGWRRERPRRRNRTARSVAAARRYDVEHHLPGDMLRKVDTASMHAGMEVRCPMLDGELADAVLGARPGGNALRRARRKEVLRELARRRLPGAVVDRPKMGFAIPIGEWFRSDFGGMRQMLRDHLEGDEPFGPESLGVAGLIRMGAVRRMLREHDAAGEGSLWPWKGRDHSQRLYMLLVLSLWARGLGDGVTE